MNSITYVHFSLDGLLSVGENADMAQDGIFLFISLIFIALVISMFASFIILRNSRKEKLADLTEISGGLYEKIEVSGVSTVYGMPNVSVSELMESLKGNRNSGNMNRMNMNPGNVNRMNMNPNNMNPGNMNPTNMNPNNMNQGNMRKF